MRFGLYGRDMGGLTKSPTNPGDTHADTHVSIFQLHTLPMAIEMISCCMGGGHGLAPETPPRLGLHVSRCVVCQPPGPVLPYA